MSLINFPERQPATPPPAAADDLLTIEEAARELRIGRTLLYELLAGGEVRSLTIGRKRFITRAEVARYKAVRAKRSLPPGAK